MSDVMHLLRTVSRPQTESGRAPARAAFIPQADVWEREDAFHLELDLPGVSTGDLAVGIEGRELSIRASRTRRRGAEEGAAVTYRLERTLQLPEGIDAEAIDAELADGVLHLTLPKLPAARPRTIEVRAASGAALTMDAEGEAQGAAGSAEESAA